MKHTEFALRRPVTTVVTFVALALVGIIAARLLPLEKFPDIEFPGIFVQIPYAGSTPEEVEKLITRPVEEALATLSGVEQMFSSSREGQAEIFLLFDWDQSMGAKGIEARAKVDGIRHLLPDDVRRIFVFTGSLGDQPVLNLRISSEYDLSGSYDMLERLLIGLCLCGLTTVLLLKQGNRYRKGDIPERSFALDPVAGHTEVEIRPPAAPSLLFGEFFAAQCNLKRTHLGARRDCCFRQGHEIDRRWNHGQFTLNRQWLRWISIDEQSQLGRSDSNGVLCSAPGVRCAGLFDLGTQHLYTGDVPSLETNGGQLDELVCQVEVLAGKPQLGPCQQEIVKGCLDLQLHVPTFGDHQFVNLGGLAARDIDPQCASAGKLKGRTETQVGLTRVPDLEDAVLHVGVVVEAELWDGSCLYNSRLGSSVTPIGGKEQRVVLEGEAEAVLESQFFVLSRNRVADHHQCEDKHNRSSKRLFHPVPPTVTLHAPARLPEHGTLLCGVDDQNDGGEREAVATARMVSTCALADINEMMMKLW